MVPAVLSAVNMSNDNDRSLRHLCRQLLGNFFRSLGNLEPWWVSIVHPVEGDETTTLTSLLGFEHDVGLQFLCSAGLLKPGPKKSYSVLIEQWDLFIVQEKLQEIMETVNKSSISPTARSVGALHGAGPCRDGNPAGECALRRLRGGW